MLFVRGYSDTKLKDLLNEETYEPNNDVVDGLIKKYGNKPYREISNKISDDDFLDLMMLDSISSKTNDMDVMADDKISSDYIKRLASKGYDAVIDVTDGIVGWDGDYPIIIFNPKKTMRKKRTKKYNSDTVEFE